jgi:hypothetical protein
MSMRETMDQELAEAIATLERANSALSRIFNTEEGENICTFCNDNAKSCRACDEGHEEGEEE